MSLLNTILGNKKLSFLLVFLVALIFRIILINIYNVKRISPDGTGYHTIAVNLVNGNGYSNSSSQPYEKYYFREPGYPLFIGFVYEVYKCFGGQPDYLNDYNIKNYSYSLPHNEITLLKYFQAFIDSLTVLFFFLSLLLLFERRYALLIALVLAFYPPYAINVTYILRETLQTFFSVLMVFTFLKFLQTKKYLWIVLYSVFWSFSNLTFQFSLVVGLFFFVLLYIYSRQLLYSVKLAFVSGIIMLVISSPWLYRTYKIYPDLRILKSYGTSLTFEYRKLINAVQKGQYYGYLSSGDFDSILRKGYMDLTAKEKFSKSFNGILSAKADSINMLAPESLLSGRKVHLISSALMNSFFPKINTRGFIGSSNIHPKYVFNGIKIFSVTDLIFKILGLFTGLFSIIGLVIYARKIYPLLLIFIAYMSFFFVIGTENRRMLPAEPFLILLAILGVLSLYRRFFLKDSFTKSSNNLIINKFLKLKKTDRTM